MNRRSFLGGMAFAGAVAAAGKLSAAPAVMGKCPFKREKARLNLALQWRRIPGGDGDVNAKLDYLEAHGYQGVEIPSDINWLRNNASKLADALKSRKLKLGPACGPSDLSMADSGKRDKEVARLCEILDVIGGIGSAGLIVCPARGRPGRR